MSGNCECGAFKVYGSKQGDRAHSSWCPWATDSSRKLCDGFDCWEKATHWIQYSRNGRRIYYCNECQVDAMATPNVTVYDFGLLW